MKLVYWMIFSKLLVCLSGVPVILVLVIGTPVSLQASPIDISGQRQDFYNQRLRIDRAVVMGPGSRIAWPGRRGEYGGLLPLLQNVEPHRQADDEALDDQLVE